MTTCEPTKLAVLGSPARCAERASLVCQSYAALPDSGYTPAKIAACADEAPDTACAVFFERRRTAGSACSALEHGTRAAGEPCVDGLQCASAVCLPEGGGNTGCARCSALAGEGEDCAVLDTSCDDGLYCNRRMPGWRCTPTLGEGEFCPDGEGMCDAGLRCYEGTCQSLFGTGDFCDGDSLDPCDHARRLACDPLTRACVKQKVEVKQIGDGCFNDDADASLVLVCAPGAYCQDRASITATCAAATVEEGHACSLAASSGGDPCVFPSSCIDGECSLPDPPLCQ
jgi:hypothetical protein